MPVACFLVLLYKVLTSGFLSPCLFLRGALFRVKSLICFLLHTKKTLPKGEKAAFLMVALSPVPAGDPKTENGIHPPARAPHGF